MYGVGSWGRAAEAAAGIGPVDLPTYIMGERDQLGKIPVGI